MDNETIFTTPFNRIKDFLINNITDPRRRFKSNWVHSSMPLINDKGFSGFPFIVLKVDVDEGNLSHDRDTSQKTFNAMITIYSTDGVEVDTLSDSIFSQFKDDTKLNFSSKVMGRSDINWFLDNKGKKVIYRNIGLICRERL